MAGAGVDDEAGRLLEHGEMLVFVDEAQLRMGGRVGARRRFVRRKLDRHPATALQNRGCTQRLPAREYPPGGDEASGLGTRKGGLVREESIDTDRQDGNAK